MGRTGAINAKVHATKLCRTFHYERARSTPLDSKLIFFAFRKVWVHLGSFRYCTKLRAKWAELVQLMQKFMHEVASELFASNARETHHGTLNSCYAAFRNVWVHLGPFCYYTKLDANGQIYCN